jgi:osmotically-inducible protein OsmY
MAHRYDERYGHEPYRGERGYGRDDRGFFERAGDEVRSWFGDDDAERRRRLDEQERERYERMRSERGWTGGERWENPDRWRSEPDRWRTESDRPRRDYGRMDYDRPGGSYRSWNEAGHGYTPSSGYGYESPSTYAQSWWRERVEPPRRDGMYGTNDRWHGEWTWGDRWRGEGRDRAMGEARGIYEDDRGRVHQFSHGQERGHTGRGPKGYQRPDARIREDVCDRLTDDWRIDASEVEVTVNNGEVTLSGTVHNRDDKRNAEDVVESIPGVREVHNNLRVSRWDETRGYERQGTPTAQGMSGMSTPATTTNRR